MVQDLSKDSGWMNYSVSIWLQDSTALWNYACCLPWLCRVSWRYEIWREHLVLPCSTEWKLPSSSLSFLLESLQFLLRMLSPSTKTFSLQPLQFPTSTPLSPNPPCNVVNAPHTQTPLQFIQQPSQTIQLFSWLPFIWLRALGKLICYWEHVLIESLPFRTQFYAFPAGSGFFFFGLSPIFTNQL